MTGFEPATPSSRTKCTTKLCYIPIFYGAPSRNRTRNLLIRSQTLYPVELWAHISLFLSTTLCYYNRVSVELQQLFSFFTAWFLGLVGMTGLEPVRCFHHRILSPMRLPIPPHPQFYGGTCQIWTGDHRVAVYCLTTWLRYHFAVLYYYIWTPIKMQG